MIGLQFIPQKMRFVPQNLQKEQTLLQLTKTKIKFKTMKPEAKDELDVYCTARYNYA